MGSGKELTTEEKIVEILRRNKEQTDNKCGVYIPRIKTETGLGTEEIIDALRVLRDKKLIRVQRGINGHLIFLK